jgi:hypothetical protein
MPRLPSRWPPYKRLSDFLPVPTRGRADGWTPHRQADFIGFLAETGSVAEAARRVGLSKESAYRLRRRRGAEGFARAWDEAVAAGSGADFGPARKFTDGEVAARALGVTLQVRMRRGRYVGTVEKSSAVMLLRHLARLDRATRWSL